MNRLRLEAPGEVEAGIAAALAHKGPALVGAVVNRTELAMPPAVTLEMAKGFTLYMVRAVMSGRGDELVDLPQPRGGRVRACSRRLPTELAVVSTNIVQEIRQGSLPERA